MGDWRVVESSRLVSNRWITVRRDVCQPTRDERLYDYYVVEKSDFAMAVALTADRRLLLVRQYKHGGGQVILECPAGYIDVGEDSADAVRRELREETGYEAREVMPLGVFLVSPSFLNNRAHFFLCLDAEPVGAQKLDALEDIEVVPLDFEQAVRDLVAGRLELDMASTAAVLLARERLAEINGEGGWRHHGSSEQRFGLEPSSAKPATGVREGES